MKFNKTLIASMVVMTCTTLATSHSVAAATPTCQATGTCQTTVYQALSSAETATLVFMREEEKLARDVYLVLHQQWQIPVFSNIASSEQQHTDKVKGLLQTYRLADPVTNDTVGVFQNPQLASLYAQLVAQGKTSAIEALQVGALIEETDIADLQKAIAGTTRPDIVQVYSNLMRGSRNHLRAFVGQLAAQGGAYTAQVLPQAEVDAIASSATERGGNGRSGSGGGGRGGRVW